MTTAMEHITATVARADSVMASATALITTISANIRANAEDPVALNALADSLDAKANELANAVTENTAAANLGGSTTVPAATDTGTGSNEPPVDAGAAGGHDAGAATDTGGATDTGAADTGSSDTASGTGDTGGAADQGGADAQP